MTHPLRQSGQSEADHQADMAEWMGCTVAQMNLWHDQMHREIVGMFGFTSHALRQAIGGKLTPAEQELADLEENAALHLQRYFHHAENVR